MNQQYGVNDAVTNSIDTLQQEVGVIFFIKINVKFFINIFVQSFHVQFMKMIVDDVFQHL